MKAMMITMLAINRIYRESRLMISTTLNAIKNRSMVCSAIVGKNLSASSRYPAKQFRSRPVGIVSKKLMGQWKTCGDRSDPEHENRAKSFLMDKKQLPLDSEVLPQGRSGRTGKNNI